MIEKVGVYDCHCGTNIAGTVDVAAVSNWAVEQLKHQVVGVNSDYKFICSSLGQKLMEKVIKDLGLIPSVVASCSAYMHEATFRNTSAQAGLNPCLFEMINVREQELMGHLDKLEATKKSQSHYLDR